MELKEIIKQARRLSAPFRVDSGKRFRLRDIDPGDTLEFDSEDKPRAKEALATGIEALAKLQGMLYAQDRWAVLVIFQAMDAAGKDGAIKHVMSGINPQGCQVYSFKAPSSEELDHDFLWRCTKNLPERGRIGIFNRSYYEETLVVRVHRELLAAQKLAPGLVTKHVWDERFADYPQPGALSRRRTARPICKIFLHVSKQEQKKRFLERLETPEKNWKFSVGDAKERPLGRVHVGLQDMIRNTATKEAPWCVVPADNKWFTRVVVCTAVIETLAGLDLAYPTVSAAKRKELAAARRALLRS